MNIVSTSKQNLSPKQLTKNTPNTPHVNFMAVFTTLYKKFWRTKTFEMANGDDLKVRWFRLIDGTGNKIRPVWKATNIQATNGYIHTISEVLLP